METYARSHTRSRATATKTSSNTFSGDNFKKQKPPLFPPSYDAVYAGASKCGTTALAPRPEDYSEIFGGVRSSSSSRACSIPVLDLPAVPDIDSVTSVFDYSEIFAGFHGVDFAVPYDELFQPFDAAIDGCSSDDAWTPVGTETLSDDSDPFASSEKSQCFSHEDSHQPLDSKKFTVSYHKVNSGASSCIPNTTHVEAVHGYTCVVDRTTPPREMETEKGRSFVADDIVFSMNSSSSTLQKHKSMTMSGNSFDTGLKSVDTDHTCERPRYSAASMSHANSKYAFESGTNLQIESHLPPPSRPPPVLTEWKGDIKRSCTGLKTSNGYASKVAVDSRLPPCFDMEVNVNSSAAVSAAAMKDAMDKAQAKLKAAKVLLDRKKDGLQSNTRTDVNGSDNITLVFDCADGDNRMQTPCESSLGVNSFVKDGHTTSTSQSMPGYVSIGQPEVITRKTAERKYGKQCSLSKDTVSFVEDGEWKEATWYNDKPRLAALAPSKDGGHVSVCKRQDDDGDERSSNSAEEACLPEENRRKLKPTNAVSRQEYHDRLIRVAQQVHESDICAHAKTDPRLTGFSQENHRDHRGANLGDEPEKNVSTIGPGQSTEGVSLVEATRIEATKGSSKNVPGKEEFKQKETEDHHKGWSDGMMYAPQQSRFKEFPDRKEEERRMGVSYERVECEGRLQENIAKQRKQSKHDVVKQKKENERREMNGSNSIEFFKNHLGGEKLQTACGNLEKGKVKELKKVEDKKSKEAFVEVPVAESSQRTCYVHESDKKKDLLQRQENGNYFRVADDCQGSGSILEGDILLECHSKCEETSTRDIRMQRQSECLQFSSGDKADQVLKQDNNEENLERVTEQKTNDKKSMQVSEMEEAVNIHEKSSYAENEEAVSSAKDKWDDEDYGSERFSEIELPVENGHLKPSHGANLCENTAEVDPDSLTSESIKPQTEATGFPDVSAWEKNVEDNAVASDEESTLEDAESAAVLDGDKPVDSTDAQMAAIDIEHERVVHGQDSSDVNNIRSKSGEVCGNTWLRFHDENKKAAQSVADPKLVTGSNIEQGGRRILDENHIPFDQDGKVKSTLTDGNNGRNEDTRDREAACAETLQKKECTHRRSLLPNNSQNTEQKGTPIDHNCSYEVKTKWKERNLEEEQLRKLEEEREREREREKDRMAVEIAIREARQRAYTDAHDRAERSAFERATDEARQKAMAEARERLEKACAEARERSLADKTSEARLRAERAAVERATAEARQRAFEKAMAERATLEARERMQRSISEKFTSERDVIMRQSSMPSMHNVKSEAPDGEPAQRCRARLERHRRTVERVAKALAEKNMRDLVAQKEQAERSRLAETLDADIKRWSNGKEGNLRALLSTLQYILAPGSGWQPIPLTEVITAAAVKKAYRKATLCVHPDKLQQRGASIQHKYICEKVFDLLKDAWNKFNSEEK